MTLKEKLAEVEKEMIERVYADWRQNQSETAKRLGISRTALIYKLKRYGLLTNKSSSAIVN